MPETSLQRRDLGASGLSVTPVGLGLAAIGRPGYITLGRDEDLGVERDVDSMRIRAHELLDAAYAAGVRYVDAARSYGRAEEFLASWLDGRGFPRGHVTVGTKWGYRYTAGWRVGAEVNEIKDHSLANLRRQVAESRGLLGDRLQLYQIHSATLESGVLEDTGVISELLRLRDEGLVIGLSVSGPRQSDVILRALEAGVGGQNPFGTVQATWNLLEPSAAPALEQAHRAGWGVIVKEALANGRLTSRASGPEGDVLRGVARRLGRTEDAIAIAAVLDQPWADMALSGAVTVAQLTSNLAAAGIALSAADLAELGDLAEPPERYWATRSARPWA